MRIAHLTTVDMSLALLLATELTEDIDQGHTVFGISAAGEYVARVEGLGVRHVDIPHLTRIWAPFKDLLAFIQLWRTLRRLKLDVLHTHTPKAGIMGRVAGRLAGIPVVVNTCHGLWANASDSLLKRVFVYGSEAVAIRFSDYEFFQNADDARTLKRYLKEGRWEVVGNGIDLQRFQRDSVGRARLRTEWGVSDDELVVGAVGRRVREKGVGEFSVVAAELGEKARFVWVGPADDTDTTVDLAAGDAVQFVGEYNDMPAVYSAFDVFVLPTYREGFSRASMEAAAVGLPMVLSDIRGCREIGTHEEHLLLTPVQDVTALLGDVRRLVEDPMLRARLGAAASIRAQQEFDQRRVAMRSLRAYDAVKESSLERGRAA